MSGTAPPRPSQPVQKPTTPASPSGNPTPTDPYVGLPQGLQAHLNDFRKKLADILSVLSQLVNHPAPQGPSEISLLTAEVRGLREDREKDRETINDLVTLLNRKAKEEKDLRELVQTLINLHKPLLPG